MDKSQAEAAAESVMGPELRRHEKIRGRRNAAVARKHRVTRFVLGGCALGAAVSQLAGVGFLTGLNLGGLAGLVVGWIYTRQGKDSRPGA